MVGVDHASDSAYASSSIETKCLLHNRIMARYPFPSSGWRIATLWAAVLMTPAVPCVAADRHNRKTVQGLCYYVNSIVSLYGRGSLSGDSFRGSFLSE